MNPTEKLSILSPAMQYSVLPKNHKQNQGTAGTISILLHAFLLLILYLSSRPDIISLPQSKGVEVTIGFNELADENPEGTKATTAAPPPAQPEEDNTIKQDESTSELEAPKNIPPKEEVKLPENTNDQQTDAKAINTSNLDSISKAGSGTGKSGEGNGSGNSGTADGNEVLKIVEEYPHFPGCDSWTSAVDRKVCSDQKLQAYLYRNVKYPDAAKSKGLQGRVVVSFVVEKDGSLSNIKLVQDIGNGCGDEALRVVNSMNQFNEKWRPGKQRGNPVRVQINLPIVFKFN